MSRLRSRIADALLAHAVRVMPASRADWARGMEFEAQHLAQDQRLPFAIGCVRSSYRLSFTEDYTMLKAGRWTIILGLCAAGALALHSAIMIRPYDASAMILLLGLICLAAAAAFLWWGFERLPMVAAAGFGAALLAIMLAGDPAALFSGAGPSGTFYRAILLEQAVCWAALFGVAHLLLALETKRDVAG